MMKQTIKKTVSSLAMVALLSANTSFAMDTINFVDEAEKGMKVVRFKIGDVNYTVGDEEKKADEAPYIKDDRTMMAVRFVADSIGVNEKDIQWNNETKTVTIFKDDKIIQMTIGSDSLIVDGEKVKMDTVAEIKDGRTMLPVSFIAKALDIDVDWNNIEKTVTFSVEKENTEEAKETVVTWNYTYEDLLSKAIENSRDLKKAELEVERAEEIEDEARDDRKYVPKGTGNGQLEATANLLHQQFKGAELQRKMAEKKIGIQKDAIAYNVKSAYYEVLKAEDNMILAKLGVNISSESMKHTNLKYEQGLVSELEKKQGERAYEEAKKQYDMAEKEVKKVYEKLNDLAGLKAEERYVLKDEVIFEKQIDDVDGHIVRTIAESPAIWGLEQKVDLADLGVKFYAFNIGSDPYDVKEIDVKTAEIDANSAKQAYDLSLRKLYTSLKQVEDQYEKEKIALEKAKDDLKTVKLNVQIGNLVPLDEKKAEFQLENSKKKLRETIMNYNTTVMLYEKPWI